MLSTINGALVVAPDASIDNNEISDDRSDTIEHVDALRGIYTLFITALC